jgi:hypothetical protein
MAEEAGAVFHGSSSACPLHGGDNPDAFHLYEGGQKWHCFTRCPQGKNDGDLFAFYMYWKQVDFPTALADLASRAGITPALRHSPCELARAAIPNSSFPPALPWQSRAQVFVDYACSQLRHPEGGAAARAYLLSERGLQPDTWDVFRLGYNPADLFDEPGRWGFEGCALQALAIGSLAIGSLKNIWLPRGIVIPGISAGQVRYVKVRRTLPGDPLSEFLGPVTFNLDTKFSGPRGGQAILFGTDLWIGFPLLLLAEGEWDAMLAWQQAGDLCDVATLGGAANKPCLADLARLSAYAAILAVYDDDPAGEQARQRFSGLKRVRPIRPPAHDLTDYWRGGADLRAWIAAQVHAQLSNLVSGLDTGRHAETIAGWSAVLQQASQVLPGTGVGGIRGSIHY